MLDAVDEHLAVRAGQVALARALHEKRVAELRRHHRQVAHQGQQQRRVRRDVAQQQPRRRARQHPGRFEGPDDGNALGLEQEVDGLGAVELAIAARLQRGDRLLALGLVREPVRGPADVDAREVAVQASAPRKGARRWQEARDRRRVKQTRAAAQHRASGEFGTHKHGRALRASTRSRKHPTSAGWRTALFCPASG